VICGVLLRVALAFFLSTYENIYEHEMTFTDIDYKVYSDAALEANPYDRHTYRYTPIIAYLNAFNYSHHEAIGKVVFALFDAIAMGFLYLIVRRSDGNKKTAEKNAILVVKMYAYNPLFIALTVRGSCESITLALMYGFWYYYFGG
jgi:phosphatidylinositol glycan class M